MAINLANPVNWQHPLNRGLLFWGLSLAGDHKYSVRDMCGKLSFPKPEGGAAWGGVKRFDVDSPIQCASSGAKVESTTPSHLKLTSEVTVSCWYRSNGSVGSASAVMFGVLWSNSNGPPYTSYCLSKGGDGDTFVGYYNQGGTFATVTSTYSTLDPSWNMWSMTLSTAQVALYFNDRIVLASSGLSGNIEYDSTSVMSFGDFTGSGGRNLNAFLNDGRIYGRALDRSEIAALYVEGRTGHRHTLNRVRPSQRAVMEVAGGGAATRGRPFGQRGTAFNGGRTFQGIVHA